MASNIIIIEQAAAAGENWIFPLPSQWLTHASPQIGSQKWLQNILKIAMQKCDVKPIIWMIWMDTFPNFASSMENALGMYSHYYLANFLHEEVSQDILAVVNYFAFLESRFG